MNEIRKRMLLDLLVNPLTLIPVATGISVVLLSEFLGSLALFGGFCLLLAGAGMVATNLVFNMDKIGQKAIKDWQAAQVEERSRSLDLLDKKLLEDRDPRDQTALRNLRSIYDTFNEDVQEGRISSGVSSSMIQQINDIFNACILQLERQYEIWKTSCRVSGKIKNKLVAQRNEIMDEVEKSIVSLSDVIGEVREINMNAKKGELSKLQEKLKLQLDTAKATEKFFSELSSEPSFDEYKNQA